MGKLLLLVLSTSFHEVHPMGDSVTSVGYNCLAAVKYNKDQGMGESLKGSLNASWCCLTYPKGVSITDWIAG